MVVFFAVTSSFAEVFSRAELFGPSGGVDDVNKTAV